MSKFFNNLKVVLIKYGRLKELSQAELQSLPGLVYLNLHFNDIEVIEDGLFDNHPSMQVVWFGVNKLFHVGKNVFNKMNKITYLGFGANQCIDMDTWNNSTAVKLTIESLKTKCFDETFASFSLSLANLENESKNLTFDIFQIWMTKFKFLENEFYNSRFSYLTSIKERFQSLKATNLENFPHLLFSKLDDQENSLKETINKTLNKTEHNLKTSIAESCSEVSYQSLNYMQDEFTKINEKLIEHSSEVRSKLI